MVYTVRYAGGRGGRNASSTSCATGIVPEELPPQPPHHLRQGRALPTDDEEMAARPAGPADHHRPAPDPARRVRRRVQPTTPTPVPATPGTPATIYTARPKANPSTDRSNDTHNRVRHDKISKTGSVTCAHNGRLHHIGVGELRGTYVGSWSRPRHHHRQHCTGELIRELLLDPTRDYQPTGRPPGRTPKNTSGPTKT
jgi:hypothetical protein